MVRALLGIPALVCLLAGCGEQRQERGTRPDLVLITIDTLRADHLSCYGNDNETTPNLDRLAASGLLYSNALSQAPWTLPSMATVHTGLYPIEHGGVSATSGIPEECTTLAEALRLRGYRTLAVVAHVLVGERHGFAQGFDHFVEDAGDHMRVSSAEITDQALALLREEEDEPFFLWVHYFDPHNEYVRHADHDFLGPDVPKALPQVITLRRLKQKDDPLGPEQMDQVRDVYDGEIAYTDAQIGRLLEGLQERVGERGLLTAVTADHGEMFGERGRFGHGTYVYPELVHVPLLLSGSIPEGLRGKRREAPVETRWLARTLIDAVSPESPAALHDIGGEDLLATTEPTAPCFTEGSHLFGADRRKHAVVSEGWKLVRHLDDGRLEQYDLTTDPDERRNLADDREPRVASARRRLTPLLDDHGRRTSSSSTIELDGAARAELEALGYGGE